MFRVEFETGNAAFDDDPAHECSRVLQHIRERLALGQVEGKCIDINGNTIGSWELIANQD